jgi:hypothetical protein
VAGRAVAALGVRRFGLRADLVLALLGRGIRVRPLVSRLSALALSLTLGASFGGVTALAAPARDLVDFPHPLWNSGIYPYQAVFEPFFWVDDNTVLFRGTLDRGRRDASGNPLHEPALYLWRLGKKPQLYGTDPVAASHSFCAVDGWDRYSRIETDTKTGLRKFVGYMAGPLGREKEEPLPPEDLPGSANNDLHDMEVPDKCVRRHDPAMVHRFWVTDTGDRYRIDFGSTRPMQEAHPLVLMRADGSHRVELPISTREAWVSCTHFHRFDGAFLVRDCLTVGNRPNVLEEWATRGNCWPVWRVEPREGTTQKMCLPFGNWVGYGIDLMPTRPGLFFVAHGIARGSDPGAAGLYRLRADTAQRLLAGFLSAPTISPSGCKAVFSYTANGKALSAPTPDTSAVLAIDVCSAR